MHSRILGKFKPRLSIAVNSSDMDTKVVMQKLIKKDTEILMNHIKTTNTMKD